MTALALVLLTSTTPTDTAGKDVALTPEQSAQARNTILAWMECQECHRGELKAVTRLGLVAVPSLIACLRKGPSAANREIMQRHLTGSYSRLKQHAATNPGYKLRRSEAEYIEHYQRKYFAQYQVRAAKALAKIGGPNAKRALEDILQIPLRKSVAREIEKSLKEFNGSTTLQ